METEDIQEQEVIGVNELKPVPAISLIIHAWAIADTYQNSTQEAPALKVKLAQIALLLKKVINA